MFSPTIVWDFAAGTALARKVEDVAKKHGFHCALAGSVLHRGQSAKDLDIIIYPHKRGDGENTAGLFEELVSTGFRNFQLRRHTAYADSKVVYTSTYQNKRVDFFML